MRGGRAWLCQQPLGCLDAVHDGHLHVHQDQIGSSAAGEVQGFAPVAGLADHSDVGWESRMSRNPERTRAWSSTIRTEIPSGSKSSGDRQVRMDEEPSTGLRLGGQCPAVDRDSLPHPDQPMPGQ